MEHLLNNCAFSSKLWDSFASIFQQSGRDKGSIINTLNKWRSNFSNNEVLSIDWALTSGFIIWNIWKERNNIIFKDVKQPPLYVIDQILKQLQETVGSIVRNLPKNPPSALDWRILYQLGLQGLIPQGLERKILIRDSELDFWHPPPQGFFEVQC